MQPARRALQTSFWSGQAAGLVLPGAGIATSIVTSKVGKELYRPKSEQQARVTLDLVGDAAYDVREAPKASWLSQPNKQKALALIKMPEASAYLYETLAAPAWRDPLSRPQ